MISDCDSSSDKELKSNHGPTKKRKKTGRITDVMKKLRVASHETGPNCECKRFRCFDIISNAERMRIIREFNELESYNDQNSYLCGLMTTLPVIRRRPRQKDIAMAKAASFNYRVRLVQGENNNTQDIQVCQKAFISLHGVTEERIKTIKKSLICTGQSPKDKRGKHNNRPHKLLEGTKNQVNDFIKNLRGRKSHYSLKDTKKLYLPDDLNIKKVWCMYDQKFPQNKVSYETFRQIFENNFNISFGYPRKDTCSTCDVLKSEIKVLKEKIKSGDEDLRLTESLTAQTAQKEQEYKLHLTKADRFYSLKRHYRKKSVKNSAIQAIAMDFQKNLPCPNITTNDVYYRRQLNFISFNIHILSNSRSIFYTYDESVAKKGADDVCSMLYHFVYKILPLDVKELVIFCDSCAGQNKNYTVFRMIHFLVTKKERFDSIKVVFPIRGHSYLECDKNMGLVNQKSYVEHPDDWREVLCTSRDKPTAFEVIDCGKDFVFQNWTDYLSPLYKPKCPFQTRPIRMMQVLKDKNQDAIFYKSTYFGPYENKPIVKKRKAVRNPKGKKENSTNSESEKKIELKSLYTEKVPIKKAKYRDLLHLSKFVERPQSKKFYMELPHDDHEDNDDADDYIDDPPIDIDQ